MANYVENKIICTKEILYNYFLDYYPFGDSEKIDQPYITFNKIVNVNSLDEYYEKYGEFIYYGWGFDYKELNNKKWEIKFLTKRLYPINAIVKSIEKFKTDIEWYAIEENYIYLSKFTWNGSKVIEEILNIETDDFCNWQNGFENTTESQQLEHPDADIWHYNFNDKSDWKIWETTNLVERYINDYPSKEYYEFIEKQKMTYKEFYEKFNFDFFDKKVEILLNDGKKISGILGNVFESENAITVGSTWIDMEDIKDIKIIK